MKWRFGFGALLVAAGCFDIPPPLELPSPGEGGSGAGGAGGSAPKGECAFLQDGACRRVSQVSSGRFHSCAIVDDGSLYCWGSNDRGQLGVPELGPAGTTHPVRVSALSTVQQVATGSEHTCALEGDGDVWCWGRNHLGQLGAESATDDERASPIAVELAGVVSLVARHHHTCALTDAAEVWCWGFALDGQGWQAGSGTAQPLPSRVEGLDALTSIEVLVSGGQFACVAGDGMTRVFCWGDNADGRLGDGTTIDSAVAIELATSPFDAPIAGLSSGTDHACLLVGDRRAVQCWGRWSWLGAANSVPTRLVEFAEDRVQQLAGGWKHGCLLMEDGTVRCYGLNEFRQLGLPEVSRSRLSPTLVPTLPPAVQLGSNRHHYGCMVARDERLWCWGDNEAPSEVTW